MLSQSSKTRLNWQQGRVGALRFNSNKRLGLKLYGKSWKKVEKHIGSWTGAQIRSHAQKFFIRLRKLFPTRDPIEVLAAHNFEGQIAFVGMEEDDVASLANFEPPQSDIDRDIQQMRSRINSDPEPSHNEMVMKPIADSSIANDCSNEIDLNPCWSQHQPEI